MNVVLNAIRVALSAIARHKTRSTLTVLGILIGVAAVVTVTALATSATEKVGNQIDSFAENALFISPRPMQAGVRGPAVHLTDNDAKAISREAVSIAAIAPFVDAQVQVIRGEKNVSTHVVGTTLPYFTVRKFSIASGEPWTESDELLKSKVCVIGQTVAKKLFEGEDPVGRTIRVGRSPYRVVGLLAKKGAAPFGEDQDDRILMPIESFRTRVVHTSPGRADQLMASTTSQDTTERATEQITSILRQRHHIPEGLENDFHVASQKELRATEEAIASVLSALLLSVAAVSLLVGGIGVMNIMLVSVSERTREIGIRMSIGAREGDILTQFLTEAVVLSIVGGTGGILLGIGGTFTLGYFLDWRIAPGGTPLAVALTTSAVIGIVFGFLPARRAAKMDPIDALRAE